MSIYNEVFPEPEKVLELEPEELALFVLEALTKDKSIRHHIDATNVNAMKDYCPDTFQAEKVARAISEAWVWLEREGLIAIDPGPSNGRVFPTRRAEKLLSEGVHTNLRNSSLMPPETLDPRLAMKVRPDFLRGDFESAVFKAFKEVEVRVRALGGFDKGLIGTKLMREAFAKERGPLTDPDAEDGEQEGIAHLFAGAIGAFKNPSSHRDVDITDAVEAQEMISLADFLIRIAERHSELRKEAAEDDVK